MPFKDSRLLPTDRPPSLSDKVWLMALMLWLTFSMPETVLIWAIWVVTWALSSGLSGSWFCICVTSNLRKRSDMSPAAAEVAAVGVLSLAMKSLPAAGLATAVAMEFPF